MHPAPCCSYVDSVLGLVELRGLRNSLVGVGAGGGDDAGLSLEQVPSGCWGFLGAGAFWVPPGGLQQQAYGLEPWRSSACSPA